MRKPPFQSSKREIQSDNRDTRLDELNILPSIENVPIESLIKDTLGQTRGKIEDVSKIDENEKPLQAGSTINPRMYFYIKREAHSEIMAAIQNGYWCHFLDSRQVGKSSFFNCAFDELMENGITPVMIDLSSFLKFGDKLSDFYFSFMENIARRLILPDILDFWLEREKTETPQNILMKYLEEVVMPSFKRVVIIIDELEMFQLWSLERSFFELLKQIRDLSDNNDKWQQLSFVLLNTSAPSDYEGGEDVFPQMKEFQFPFEKYSTREAEAYLPFLQGREDFLEEVLRWTGGHPYFTAKLVKDLSQLELSGLPVKETTDECVRRLFFQHSDGDVLLRMLKKIFSSDELFSSEQLTALMALYERLATGEEIQFQSKDWNHITLVLRGLAVEQDGFLRVRNMIIQEYFKLSV